MPYFSSPDEPDPPGSAECDQDRTERTLVAGPSAGGLRYARAPEPQPITKVPGRAQHYRAAAAGPLLPATCHEHLAPSTVSMVVALPVRPFLRVGDGTVGMRLGRPLP